MRTLIPALALAAATSLVVAGCSSSGSDSTTSSPAATGVTTTEHRYADTAPTLAYWSEPTLDIVAIPGGTGRPLVVILPPHSLTKADPAMSALARSLAEHNTVAVVANWSQLVDPPEVFQDPGTLAEFARTDQSLAGCAVSYAAAHAADFGADARHLVLVGDLFGANMAARIALATPDAYPGCRSSTPWKATAVVGIDGVWLVAMEAFDAVGAAAFASLSPWSLAKDATGQKVTLVSSDAAVSANQRCGAVGAPWMVARDPSGSVRAQLRAVGAYKDGCVDPRDEALALAEHLIAAGIPAEVMPLTNPDSRSQLTGEAQFLTIGPSDLEALTTVVLAATT